jgi:hypothetical protein
MNTSELEQRMKQLLEEQEYAPTDASWQKMHEALHPPLAKRRSLLLLLPAWKMAAAVALLLTGSLGAYLFLKEEKKTAPAVAIQKVDPQQTAPATGPEENIADITETVPETTAGTHQPAIAIVPAAKNKLVHDTAVQAPHVAAQQDLPPAVVPGAQKPSPQNSLEQQSSQQQRNYLPVFQHTPPDYERKTINLGLAANIGKPSLGNVQYNVGVVARKDIGSRIFAEANVSLASTQVNYSEKIASEVALSGVGDFSSESANPPREIMLNYSSNVIAVGVAPVIGLKATRNLSVSVGGDVYKTLNRNLDFKNSPDATLKNASVTPPAKVITDWDAGVKAQLDYRLGKRLSMNTQYRQGLTQYILVNGNKPIRNSIFNLGFKYYIGK